MVARKNKAKVPGGVRDGLGNSYFAAGVFGDISPVWNSRALPKQRVTKVQRIVTFLDFSGKPQVL
jgi:hypothetical protein